MTYSELKRLLKKNGCELLKEGKRHELWLNQKTNETFTVGRHDKKEVATGTLKSILESAGLK